MGIVRSRGLVIVCAVLLLAGCAAAPRQAFNREAHTELRRIGLLVPASSGEYLVQNFGHPGMGFGLIGGLVAAADMQVKTTEFSVQARDTKFDAVAELVDLMRSELVAAGYDVRVITPSREKPALLERYDALDGDVDAYLDSVLIFAGYFTASAVSDFAGRAGARRRDHVEGTVGRKLDDHDDERAADRRSEGDAAALCAAQGRRALATDGGPANGRGRSRRKRPTP